MSFLKVGAPQPIHIASGKCEICNSQPSVVLYEGKMICLDCKIKLESNKSKSESEKTWKNLHFQN